jgi:hypothetical protein
MRRGLKLQASFCGTVNQCPHWSKFRAISSGLCEKSSELDLDLQWWSWSWSWSWSLMMILNRDSSWSAAASCSGLGAVDGRNPLRFTLLLSASGCSIHILLILTLSRLCPWPQLAGESVNWDPTSVDLATSWMAERGRSFERNTRRSFMDEWQVERSGAR